MDFDFTTETITPDNTNILTIGGTGALELPSGTTLQEPLSAIAGAIRWNTTNTQVEYYTGALWTTFVTPISGTANQISASASTGAVTLSTPSVFIAPGSLQYSTIFGYSAESLTAAGSTQATATPVTKTFSNVTSASATNGIRLPVPSFTGELHILDNDTGVEIYVWPHVGGAIDEIAVDTNTYLPSELTMSFVWDGAVWCSIVDAITEGNTGITVSHVAGNVVISNNGVLSIAGGTTGLTPVLPTTGAITLGGTLSIANGGTGATSTTVAFNNLSPLTTAGDTLYFNGTNNVRLPIGTTNQQLTVISGEPAWTDSVNSVITGTTGLLANGVNTAATGPVTLTGVLNLANGGTQSNLTAVAGGVVYSSGSAMAISVAGTSGQALISGGTSAPTWQGVASTITTNQIIEGNGSGTFTANGATFVGSGSYSGVTLSGTITNSTDAVTKSYVDNIATGLIWIPPVNIVNLVGTATSPPGGTPQTNDAYIIYPGGVTGVWSGFAVGDLVQYQAVYGWVNLGAVSVGARFVVSAVSTSTLTGDVVGYKNYLAVITGGTSSAWTWSFSAPINNWATSVGNQTASFYGSSWTYSTSLLEWVQFTSIAHYYAGTGLSLSGGDTFNNTGVLSNVAGTGISVSSATGNVTVTNTGVTSVTAGSGISVSASTGSITISSTATAPTIQNVSTTYTVLSSDYTVFADASAGAFTVSLPATPTTGEIHNIKKIDQTRLTVTINGNGHNIDKYSTVVVNVPFTSIEVQWNSATSTWQII
jgi:hypothetical protein